jgi:hypothetical protein
VDGMRNGMIVLDHPPLPSRSDLIPYILR